MHWGHLRVLGSGDSRRLANSVSRLTGLTTKKNTTKATVMNAISTFRKCPERNVEPLTARSDR